MPRRPAVSARRGAVWLTSLALLVGPAALAARARASDGPRLDFVPPEPGTYRLQRIMRAPEGRVLTVDGRAAPLSQFTRERITLLGFIYTTCVDPEGCPLAYRVFYRLKDEIQAAPTLADKVQLVTLSFDPAHDSPEVMKLYAGSQLKEEGGLRWYFLTTRSVGDLLPLVEGFGQDVRYSVDKSTGRPESCFWVMGFLVLACLVWLHTVVSGMRRRSGIRLRPVALDTGDRIGAGA